ncbi:MAG TPA: tRNA (adenosine(37)-N6)-dimethylallyltransferase MiaA [Vicinamibacteria bacterium]|nr:tRNA (adenosine(37)-N6)-dimethylallyltransferase MiaA [Vicinamibacteria bacterium]
MAPPLIAVVGPTAAGKSATALRLAEAGGGEIVSCDSLQVYRGLDIGSAKATPEERALVPHHLLDVVDPSQDFSAADYARRARQALAGIRERGRLAIVAGGTGLYLRALLEGLFEGPARDEALRARFERMAARRGPERLHRLLARVDPEAAARIPPRDRVRIVRALEVFVATGRPLTAHHRDEAVPLTGFSVHVLAIAPPRDVLRAAVERRTAEMFERGLLDEVRGLLAAGHPPDLRPLRAIGYRQAVEVIAGRRTEGEARRDIVVSTMQYAKRQLTWFRHQTAAVWFASAADALRGAQRILDGEA